MPDTFAQGIDVSRWQRTVDWGAVKAAGISYAFAKATQSTNITDAYFAANWTGMQAAGILRGAYHYFLPNVDPARQMDYFVRAVPWAAGDLPLVLDVETDGGLDKPRLLRSLETALQELERLGGHKPILYTAPNFWNTRVAYPTPPAWTSQCRPFKTSRMLCSRWGASSVIRVKKGPPRPTRRH